MLALACDDGVGDATREEFDRANGVVIARDREINARRVTV